MIERSPCLILLLLGACGAQDRLPAASDATGPPELAVPNDNRFAAGSLIGDTLEIHLEARPVRWQPEGPNSHIVPAFAFAERGQEATIPGPLIRVPEGTSVDVTITNLIPQGLPIGLPPPNRRTPGMASVTSAELFVHWPNSGSIDNDVIRIPYGEQRNVRFHASESGTYLYWADTTNRSRQNSTGPDAQLAGAIVVDPASSPAQPNDRIFVITMTDSFDDGSESLPCFQAKEQECTEYGMFELAINGRSWPHTERLSYLVGDEIHWRWVNGTGFEHPMHLHGFHFRTRARGDGLEEFSYPSETIQNVVTELMEPGSTFRMDWTPTRKGNWLMHCHIRDHIIPDPPRSQSERMNDMHDVRLHALQAMAGLVMGITVTDDGANDLDLEPDHRLHLVVRERMGDDGRISRGYALAAEGDPLPEGFQGPGPPVVLTRGEITRITISSEIKEPTTVHWHGMELQSIYDGVAGWSGAGERLAPLITSDRPFDAYIEPPRAGTFIYHTHMDETDQLRSGLYGPLIVVEPGEAFDPASDLIFVIGDAPDGDYQGVTINGRQHPDPVVLQAGLEYRLRFIDIGEGATVDVSLVNDTGVIVWRALAKDGADLPTTLQRDVRAEFRMGVGETYDFLWRPSSPMLATLEVDWIFATEPGHVVLRQPIEVE